MTPQSPYVIELSAADRAVLEKRSRSHTAPYPDVVRARIVLLCADGHQNTAIAARLGVHVSMVRTWRKRFFEAGLVGLADRPRPGRPRSVPSRTADGEAPPTGWDSTVPVVQAVADGVVVPVRGPGAMRRADQARGRKRVRQPHGAGASAAAEAAQLIPFRSRHSTTAGLDALRHLVSSINRYLAEMDAAHAQDRAGVSSPRGR
jgi:transposase-like protein